MRDGQVKSLLAMGGTDAKGKQIPRTMKLPVPVKRSSGVAANFLCDNSAYVLGVDRKREAGTNARMLCGVRAEASGHLEGCASPNG